MAMAEVNKCHALTQWNAAGWDVGITASRWSALSADSALTLLHTPTNLDNHTLISTPGSFIALA